MIKATGTNTTIGNKETFLDRNAKLIPSDETTTALTNAKWIAGHHEVANLNSLYKVYNFILSPSFYAGGSDNDVTQGADAVGQLWYVRDQKAYYQLIDWSHRGEASGWSKTNIKAANGPGGASNTQYANTNGSKGDCIKDLTLTGDGTLTYNAWNLNMDNDQLSTGVRLKYTKSDGTANTALTTIPLVNETKKTSGVISSEQYKSLLDRITYLETWTIWKARVGTDTNTSTYLWSGTLENFNKLKSKPTDTTFIVTN